MVSNESFLRDLVARGVTFHRTDDGVIRWADPRRTLTAEERIALRGLRREIDAVLDDGASHFLCGSAAAPN